MKPILFNIYDVSAILDGQKTVTRRVVKPQPPSNTHPNLFVTPPYRAGDILYVREAFAKCAGEYVYKASNEKFPGIWRPSTHMPKEAARIFLRVTDVRVDRLQDITAEQVLDEGVDVKFPEPKPSYISLAYTEMRLKPSAIKQFADLWNSTIKPADIATYGWAANPWVFVIEFEKISKEDAVNVK